MILVILVLANIYFYFFLFEIFEIRFQLGYTKFSNSIWHIEFSKTSYNHSEKKAMFQNTAIKSKLEMNNYYEPVINLSLQQFNPKKYFLIELRFAIR